MNSGPDDPVVRFSTLVEALRRRALQHPDQRIYSYLIDGEREGQHLTFAALDRQARAIGALLQRSQASGQRALLLYPSGLDFIAAFFGCLYAGVIAVPVPSPNPAQPRRGLSRLSAIAGDAEATIALTTSAILSKVEGPFSEVTALGTMRWIASDCVDSDLAHDWREPPANADGLALLQYTSGSTTTARGVMVSHRNLIHNSMGISRAFEITPDTVSVTWLPAFHDMGLTNGIIQPLLNGRQCYLMPPQCFLQRPLRWLQAISHYRASISGGPNFAYELCARRITPEQCGTLDLSSWTAAYNGAEPIRAETLKLFSATFAPYGFQPHFLYPCYGLAEATLLVSGGRLSDEPTTYASDSAELEHNRVVPARASSRNAHILVGCGSAIPGSRIVIVDPESRKLCAPAVIGEIWVAGPSVAAGYWNRSEETTHTFHAYLSDSDEGPFLRTGDLGFLHGGELFVTGRLKDLIIIDGRNVYPHDIEITAERSHSAIRPGCCAAFSIESPEERLIVAAELDRYHSRFRRSSERSPGNAPMPPDDINEVVRSIRRAVAEEHDVRAHSIVLLKPGSLPRTPSGKLQRHVCRSSFLDGTLANLSDALDTSEIRQQRLAAHV